MFDRLYLFCAILATLILVLAAGICRFIYNLWTRGQHERNQQEWESGVEDSD